MAHEQLLTEIQRGICLRPTKTNDRSVPLLKSNTSDTITKFLQNGSSIYVPSAQTHVNGYVERSPPPAPPLPDKMRNQQPSTSLASRPLPNHDALLAEIRQGKRLRRINAEIDELNRHEPESGKPEQEQRHNGFTNPSWEKPAFHEVTSNKLGRDTIFNEVRNSSRQHVNSSSGCPDKITINAHQDQLVFDEQQPAASRNFLHERRGSGSPMAMKRFEAVDLLVPQQEPKSETMPSEITLPRSPPKLINNLKTNFKTNEPKEAILCFPEFKVISREIHKQGSNETLQTSESRKLITPEYGFKDLADKFELEQPKSKGIQMRPSSTLAGNSIRGELEKLNSIDYSFKDLSARFEAGQKTPECIDNIRPSESDTNVERAKQDKKMGNIGGVEERGNRPETRIQPMNRKPLAVNGVELATLSKSLQQSSSKESANYGSRELKPPLPPSKTMQMEASSPSVHYLREQYLNQAKLIGSEQKANPRTIADLLNLEDMDNESAEESVNSESQRNKATSIYYLRNIALSSSMNTGADMKARQIQKEYSLNATLAQPAMSNGGVIAPSKSEIEESYGTSKTGTKSALNLGSPYVVNSYGKNKAYDRQGTFHSQVANQACLTTNSDLSPQKARLVTLGSVDCPPDDAWNQRKFSNSYVSAVNGSLKNDNSQLSSSSIQSENEVKLSYIATWRVRRSTIPQTNPTDLPIPNNSKVDKLYLSNIRQKLKEAGAPNMSQLSDQDLKDVLDKLPPEFLQNLL